MQNGKQPENNPRYDDDQGRKSPARKTNMTAAAGAFDTNLRALVAILMKGRVPQDGSNDTAVFENALNETTSQAAVNLVETSYKTLEVDWSKQRFKTKMQGEMVARSGERRQVKAVDVIARALQDRFKRE